MAKRLIARVAGDEQHVTTKSTKAKTTNQLFVGSLETHGKSDTVRQRFLSPS